MIIFAPYLKEIRGQGSGLARRSINFDLTSKYFTITSDRKAQIESPSTAGCLLEVFLSCKTPAPTNCGKSRPRFLQRAKRWIREDSISPVAPSAVYIFTVAGLGDCRSPRYPVDEIPGADGPAYFRSCT
jgi:hypothetical protein